MGGDLEVATLYLAEEMGDTGVVKGEGPAQQGIQNDSTGPHVYLRTSVQLGEGKGGEGRGGEGGGERGGERKGYLFYSVRMSTHQTPLASGSISVHH